jgi:hypothetical protein
MTEVAQNFKLFFYGRSYVGRLGYILADFITNASNRPGGTLPTFFLVCHILPTSILPTPIFTQLPKPSQGNAMYDKSSMKKSNRHRDTILSGNAFIYRILCLLKENKLMKRISSIKRSIPKNKFSLFRRCSEM